MREAGLRASVRSLVRRQHRDVVAVEDITFSLQRGEIVGFLGPNGAGKTTTLKMLAGLLVPTGGSASVLGFEPARRQSAFLRRIALVMGNRNQLQWDLPALDSFELHRAIYRLDPAAFRTTRDELIDLLDLGGLVDKPVRNLSLGERMKVELADALLHLPDVLFLDEPTLGLDLVMQRRLRVFLADFNRRHGSTILLTSHYMADVEALCKRVVMIHRGRLGYDGALSALAAQVGVSKTIRVRLADASTLDVAELVAEAAAAGVVVADPEFDVESATLSVAVEPEAAASVSAHLLARLEVVDVAIVDPPIDDVIERLFDDAPADDASTDDASAGDG